MPDVEVLVKLYEPEVYTAAEAIGAGQVVRVNSAGEVVKITGKTETPAGVALIKAAASGDKITIVHGGHFRNVSGTSFTAGDQLQPESGGGVAKWEGGVTGQIIGYAITGSGGTREVFIY